MNYNELIKELAKTDLPLADISNSLIKERNKAAEEKRKNRALKEAREKLAYNIENYLSILIPETEVTAEDHTYLTEQIEKFEKEYINVVETAVETFKNINNIKENKETLTAEDIDKIINDFIKNF